MNKITMWRVMLSMASMTALDYQTYAGCYIPTGVTECAKVSDPEEWHITCGSGDYTVVGRIQESEYQNAARDAKAGETGVDAAFSKYCIYTAAGNDCNGNPISKTFKNHPTSTCSPSGNKCPSAD